MAVQTMDERLQALRGRLQEVSSYLHIEENRSQVAELESQSAQADFGMMRKPLVPLWSDLHQMRSCVRDVDEAAATLEDAEAALQLSEETADDELLAEVRESG